MTSLRITSTSFDDGVALPSSLAFGKVDAATHIALSDNRNPQLNWAEAPPGTKSFALVCVDTDVPSSPEGVNQEGESIPVDLPRGDFYHWLIANIPMTCNGIDEGEFADGVTAQGKNNHAGPDGSLHGLNDYTSWFEGDADMGGDYYGYDGPCPPWNDERVHHYRFQIFALGCESLDLRTGFRGADLMAAMDGHIIAQAEIVGRYALNPLIVL